MTLRSFIFAGDKRLEASLRDNSSHIARGASGDHVRLIQTALVHLDGAVIDPVELTRGFYGPSTARAVLAFKNRRNIVNRSYQKSADDIVGKMTIAALDAEMLASERPAPLPRRKPHGPARMQRSAAEIAARGLIEQAIRTALAKLG